MDQPISIPPEQFQQLKATIGSKFWRISHLYKIVNKTTKQLEFLKLNAIQQQIYDSVKDRKRLREFYLKYRQGGVSTFWLIWWLDEAIFHENTNCGILSHTKESLNELWDVIRIAYDNMPSQYKPKFGTYNKTTLSFPEINSKIFVSLSIRSTRVDNLHISEACFMETRDIRASKAAVPPNGNITIESTANGMGNEGYFMYQEAKEASNGYKAMFFPWWIQPEYKISLNGMRPPVRTSEELALPIDDEQVLFRRYQKKEQKELYYQEYAEDDTTAFLSTGNPFFDNKKIMKLIVEAREMDISNPPEEETEDYVIWESPQRGHVYVIGSDVAEGIGEDYSAAKVLCVTCRQEAMAFRGHVRIDDYYRILNDYGIKYNRALLGVERNNHGHAVLLGLTEDCRYPNLFKEEERDRPIFVDLSKPRPEPRWGWNTTTISKAIMMDHLKVALEGDSQEDENSFMPEYRVRDLTFLSECLTMQRNGNKLEATQGKHDDTVIASAIAFQMYLKKKSKNTNGRTDLEKVILGTPRHFI